VLLAHVLERLDGVPIDEVMQRRVFGPTGMTNAGMEVSPPWDESSYDTPLVVPRLATGYNGAPGRLQEASSRMYAIPGAGAAYGTAEDLLAFARALFEGDLLPAELRQAAVDVADEVSVPYALGWVVKERYGARVYRHDGGNNGYLASVEYYPDRRLTVIVLSNFGFAPIEEIRDAVGGIALSE
jgi:CubicO group peptidase (beta-lactamase class C family)